MPCINRTGSDSAEALPWKLFHQSASTTSLPVLFFFLTVSCKVLSRIKKKTSEQVFLFLVGPAEAYQSFIFFRELFSVFTGSPDIWKNKSGSELLMRSFFSVVTRAGVLNESSTLFLPVDKSPQICSPVIVPEVCQTPALCFVLVCTDVCFFFIFYELWNPK